MELQRYIQEVEKQYHLRLKTVVPLDDETMARIESCMAKYDPVEISGPRKTIMQRMPLDFPHLTAGEVYIVDFTFTLPAAPQVVQSDIRAILEAPDSFVIVRTRNEPGELETERYNALADIEEEAVRRGLRRGDVLSDSDYSEADTEIADSLFGEKYNEALVAYLTKVEHERQAAIRRYEEAPFRWLPLTGSAEVEDEAPPPFDRDLVRNKPAINQHLLGGFEAWRGTIKRTYFDKNGKRVVLTRELGERP